MKIYSWNVNGLRAVFKKKALQNLIETESPDIVCLQEIKCSIKDAEVINTYMTENNYTVQILNPAKKKGYAGTAIYSKVPITSFNIDIHKGDEGAKEGRCIVAEFDKFFIINVYVPNSKPDLSRLDERINVWETATIDLINELEQKKPIILCGDLNVAPEEIDLKNPKTNRGKHGFTDEERAAFRTLLKSGKKGLVDIFRYKFPTTVLYSWFSPFAKSRERNVGWRIDMFIVSKKLTKTISVATIKCEFVGSDHCPLYIEL